LHQFYQSYPPPPHPHYFCANLANCDTHIFKDWGGIKTFLWNFIPIYAVYAVLCLRVRPVGVTSSKKPKAPSFQIVYYIRFETTEPWASLKRWPQQEEQRQDE